MEHALHRRVDRDMPGCLRCNLVRSSLEPDQTSISASNGTESVLRLAGERFCYNRVFLVACMVLV